MEVKAGYKQSEVGVIPEEWEVDIIGNICLTSSGTTPPRSLEARYYLNGTSHWVKTTDLNNSNILETEELVTKFALNETSLKVYPVGTVLVAMYGGFNQIGRTGLLRVPAAVNQALTAIQLNRKKLDSVYLINILNFKVDYWKNVASSSRKDPNITSQDVRDFPIPIPPLPEQRAIATALSDIDALISALDELIAKKRDIKQATMQQLLTGNTRLPGFEGEWEVKTLGELGTWRGGGTPSKKVETYWNGDIPWVSPKDFDGILILETEDHITPLALTNSSTTLIGKESILVVARSSILRSKVPIAKNIAPVAINQDVKALTVHKTYDVDFLLQSLLVFSKNIKDSSVKVGTTVESIDLKAFTHFQIPISPTTEEQKAIAAILSDMDAEIVALEGRRDKTRALKLGMMQELLTGRTRLV